MLHSKPAFASVQVRGQLGLFASGIRAGDPWIDSLRHCSSLVERENIKDAYQGPPGLIKPEQGLYDSSAGRLLVYISVTCTRHDAGIKPPDENGMGLGLGLGPLPYLCIDQQTVGLRFYCLLARRLSNWKSQVQVERHVNGR